VACDALPPFSGYFDTPPLLETSQGYWYIFTPRQDEVVVVNTGVHGDHFHDAEVLTRMDSSKPIHPAVSPDMKYVAFSEDSSKQTLVIEVSAPAKNYHYGNGGTQRDSHATVAFDDDNRLYSGDMKSAQGSNLLVIDPATGSTLRSGDAGKSPHGAVYSPVTKKVYFNTADGIHISGKDSDEGNFSYQHTGFRLVRSWMGDDGRSLVSYVRNLATGIEYDSVVVYDITTKNLVREIDVNVTAPDLSKYGYANSEFAASKGLVLLGDPQTGKVHIIDITTGEKTVLQMEGPSPQSLRVTIDNHGDDAWVATKDGTVSRICLEDLEVETVYHLENAPGVNFVIAAVSPETGEHHDHEHEDDHEHGIYDPHTWVSPFLAKQQAKNIYEAFVKADPDNEPYYTQRWNALKARFDKLDDSLMTGLANKKKSDIFVTHSAFGYLAERYGFHQHGVIGISADEQPSVSAIQTMVEEMEEHGIYVIYTDPIYSEDYAQTLKGTLEAETGKTVQILKLYLILDPQDGRDYFEQQESNLDNLKIGLEA
jgi:zinc transport system substrate-binding protein